MKTTTQVLLLLGMNYYARAADVSAVKEVPESSIVRVGGTAYVSGQVDVSVGNSTAAQAWAVLHKVDAALASKGMSKHNIVHTEGVLADIGDLRTFNVIYNQWMSGVEILPASTVYEGAALISGAKVEVAVQASILPKTGTNGTSEHKLPPGYPLPFTTAVTSGDFVYLSGLQGKGNTSAEQIEGALRNIDAALASVGLDKNHLVSMQGVLADIRDLPTLNVIYNRWLSGVEVLPASMVHQPTNLCGYGLVEITMVASTIRPAGQNISADPLHKKVPFPLPFTSVVQVGGHAFTSGMLSLAANESTEEQLVDVFQDLDKSLALVGLCKHNVVESRAVLRDIGDLATFSKIYGSWLSGVQILPATLVHQPGNLSGSQHVRVEVSLVAVDSPGLTERCGGGREAAILI